MSDLQDRINARIAQAQMRQISSRAEKIAKELGIATSSGAQRYGDEHLVIEYSYDSMTHEEDESSRLRILYDDRLVFLDEDDYITAYVPGDRDWELRLEMLDAAAASAHQRRSAEKAAEEQRSIQADEAKTRERWGL